MSSDTTLSESAYLKQEDAFVDNKEADHSNSLVENLKSLTAGGVGGVCAVLTGHPFDLVKVRCQNGQAKSAGEAVAKILSSARGAVGGTMVTNSVKGFYKGVVPPLLGVTPIFAVSFWGYDMGKKLVTWKEDTNTLGNVPLTTSQMAAAGFISAVPTTLVMAPTERVKVVLQTSSGGSFLSAARKLVSEGGVQSLFKGSLATLARDGPGSALYFASYEVCKKFLNSKSGNTQNGEINIKNVCISGGIAGMSMWIVVFPIDTIKTKLQASSTRQNMLSATREIYNTRGGIKGFFPGLGPALLRSFPANAATFLGVELTHSLFKKYNI
ncbi:hypothetical protein HG535_0A03000 [Zygotorulaspora mrakii]|uniref:Uncharacterized protein n=1 Tax=Zygotorulaspora mrakii TaxID=42260 RepID=A0A7H9AVW7_ZYGMR|nr:uncharacterized protein HG535_0A03000 [Zygotorulaspora mrakii]QLG70361.1 hypothetical protein HG535_0A03000 [Zygotorulaspora mrakii]